MKRVIISLYSFNELTAEAQEKAINEQAIFLTETNEEYENITREEVINSILINDYLFFEDGEMAHITHYTGKHEKTGKTEFHFHGKTFDITRD